VDDGSNDNTRDIVQSYGSQIRYIYQNNAGLASARNAGLALARGEFIAFQDSDDIWMPWKLEVQIDLMQHHPEVAFTWTDVNAVNEHGKIIGERHLAKILGAYGKIDTSRTFARVGLVKDFCTNCPAEISAERYRCGDIFTAMTFGNLIHPPTVLMRRASVHAAGGEDVTFTHCGEDYEFFWRLARTGWGAIIDSPGMLYRVGAKDQYTQAGSTLPEAYGYLYALKRRLTADRTRIQLSEREIRDCLSHAYSWVFEQELRAPHGRWSPGYLWKSVWLKPLQRRFLLLLPFGLIPRPFFRFALNLKRRIGKALFGRKAEPRIAA
jgi:glycosyltransferase involved in cell wall biosynthesis